MNSSGLIIKDLKTIWGNLGCLYSKIDKISVIIPCYNSGNTVKKQLDQSKRKHGKILLLMMDLMIKILLKF